MRVGKSLSWTQLHHHRTTNEQYASILPAKETATTLNRATN